MEPRTSDPNNLLLRLLRILLGMAIFWLFLTAGILLKNWLGLILPANILGMLLLLGALSGGIVKLHWIEPAGKWLLFFLPLLFVPIYAGAGAYKAIWIQWGWLIVPLLVASVIAMWLFVGHLYQLILRGK